MNLWFEFKRTVQLVFPWVIIAVLGIYIYQDHRAEVELLAQISARQQATTAQEVRGIRSLMSQQGYTVPPPNGTR